MKTCCSTGLEIWIILTNYRNGLKKKRLQFHRDKCRVLLADKIKWLQTKEEEKKQWGSSIKENDLDDYGRWQVEHKPTNSGKKRKYHNWVYEQEYSLLHMWSSPSFSALGKQEHYVQWKPHFKKDVDQLYGAERASRSNVHFSFNHLTDFTVSNCSSIKETKRESWGTISTLVTE